MAYVNREGAIDAINLGIKLAGTQAAFALQAGVSVQFLNNVLKGRKEPSPAILAQVGLVKETMYRRLEKAGG